MATTEQPGKSWAHRMRPTTRAAECCWLAPTEAKDRKARTEARQARTERPLTRYAPVVSLVAAHSTVAAPIDSPQRPIFPLGHSSGCASA